MDLETERLIDESRSKMEAIVFLKDGTVEKVETPYGKEIPECDRSQNVQSLVEMYRDWPHKVTAARKDAGSNWRYVLSVNRSLFCEVAANIEPRFILMRFIE